MVFSPLLYIKARGKQRMSYFDCALARSCLSLRSRPHHFVISTFGSIPAHHEGKREGTKFLPLRANSIIDYFSIFATCPPSTNHFLEWYDASYHSKKCHGEGWRVDWQW